ncbi:MAG: PEP-CTERM sorting domain-containing protein [Marinobacter sp.]|uniref:PEP-CTERM sorting domain-containing protein n=1 Tax=Marinobacter sp. TaxID=50741 RepID=UPI00299DA8B1|nr:PEP-CTERM sorting domain-containing protein [Marinobacter sp.]MDX1756198.1 PEP-CTERM sorting domain-containing protein [Marinobacter sp.]
MKYTILLTIWALLSSPAIATVITIDPDDFSDGDLLTSVSPHVTIGTTGGNPVYASSYQDASGEDPPGFVNTGPIGDRVFSSSAASNSEWMASVLGFSNDDVATVSDLTSSIDGLMLFSFHSPVNWVSVLSMEYLQDAGWGLGSDPIMIFLYDSLGNLISFTGDEQNKTPLPYSGDAPFNPYAYFLNEFSAPDIGYLAIGGFSEPTTVDRLEFRVAEVPEPSTLALVVTPLMGWLFRRRRL